jgi:hypothetical protein
MKTTISAEKDIALLKLSIEALLTPAQNLPYNTAANLAFHLQARDLFDESRSSFKEVGDQAGMAEGLIGKELIPSCLEGLAAVAAEQGELVWAAHLWGAAEDLREVIATPIPPVYRLDYERTVAKARAQLGNEAFARAWALGRTNTLEQAMAADHT